MIDKLHEMTDGQIDALRDIIRSGKIDVLHFVIKDMCIDAHESKSLMKSVSETALNTAYHQGGADYLGNFLTRPYEIAQVGDITKKGDGRELHP